MTTPNGAGRRAEHAEPQVFVIMFTREDHDGDGFPVGAHTDEQAARKLMGRLTSTRGHYYLATVDLFGATA